MDDIRGLRAKDTWYNRCEIFYRGARSRVIRHDPVMTQLNTKNKRWMTSQRVCNWQLSFWPPNKTKVKDCPDADRDEIKTPSRSRITRSRRGRTYLCYQRTYSGQPWLVGWVGSVIYRGRRNASTGISARQRSSGVKKSKRRWYLKDDDVVVLAPEALWPSRTLASGLPILTCQMMQRH